ncbi:hypothetical protein ANCDUO_07590 [Ancylostoma duodenale]|uniref:Sulfite exporter TauE/SafE n=1 Tax=Ancylostoma duodenale TaxID=51022 RepID=A0A0C2GYB3_9BILA|nr:hypothetical protein ANCDUO_07590 [Ancylostoma duodenale]
MVTATEPNNFSTNAKAVQIVATSSHSGQQLSENVAKTVPEDADFLDRILIRHRKYVAFLVPFAIMQLIWWVTAFRFNWFALYESRWQMPVVMFFGSTVAGMTSEGGGAVAFPVMTLLLQIDPSIARDFSLIIQSAGMTCAMCVVLIMQIQIEKRAILFGTMGSVPGFVLGSVLLDAYLSAAQKKMLFVSIWSSFAIALFILNSQHNRRTYDVIPQFNFWKAAVLVLTGLVGGVFTAFAGSGVDICTFSIITLLFRVSEKTATPTSVVLMGINTMVGVYWRAVWQGDVPSLAWEYAAVSVPVAVTMAPLGILQGTIIIVMSFGFFTSIAKVGQALIDDSDEQQYSMLNANMARIFMLDIITSICSRWQGNE